MGLVWFQGDAATEYVEQIEQLVVKLRRPTCRVDVIQGRGCAFCGVGCVDGS